MDEQEARKRSEVVRDRMEVCYERLNTIYRRSRIDQSVVESLKELEKEITELYDERLKIHSILNESIRFHVRRPPPPSILGSIRRLLTMIYTKSLLGLVKKESIELKPLDRRRTEW